MQTVGNTGSEPDVNFTLRLSQPVNATIDQGVAIGNIVARDFLDAVGNLYHNTATGPTQIDSGVSEFEQTANGNLYDLHYNGTLQQKVEQAGMCWARTC